MQTGTREYLGKNKFWTPSNIAITQSIVDNSIAKISLTDSNSTELFSVTSDSTAIQTKDNVPLQASQFIITGTNAEIDEDENNAVNKRYLVDKITPLDSKFMTQAQCDERYYDKDTVDEKLATKVNNDYLSQNYYDKGTIDSKLSENAFDASNYYTKDEVDTNISTVNNNFSNYYTKTEVDNKLSENQFDANNYYDKDTLDNYLSLKADKNFVLANYYNRTDMDAKLATKATTTQLQEVYQNTYNKGQVYNKTEIDDKITTINNNFGNYYTKTEIDAKFSSFNSKDLLSLITDNEKYISFSSNEILLYEVDLSSSSSTNPFYTGNTMAFYFIYFYFTTTQSTSTLMEKIRKFTIKFDDGVFTYSGWIGTGTNGIKVRFNYVSSGQYIPTKFALYFEPKTIDSSFTNRFTTIQASVDRKKA